MESGECWAWPTEQTLGSDLAGKSLGMVGFGRIGTCMARMCSGFRMRMMAYDPNVSASVMAASQVEKVDSVEELCQRADAISVHATLNPTSRGVLSKAAIALLPAHAVAVNVSRGEIWDERAVADAVLQGRLSGVGADVFGIEPLSREASHPFAQLVDRDDCIFTPHLAFWTKEARERLEAEALERCLEALEGRPLRVLSSDPRLLGQAQGLVELGGLSTASGRWVFAPSEA
eukprot:Hpha_TRINITY_DN19197_c0_g1::TRINITY_DN19197_c0_g1_i1::g.94716::m.94716/K00058/serA, PHGDH; D-3-phosphoglycerate dehydrogenase / 2-oxoglutarate reductase